MESACIEIRGLSKAYATKDGNVEALNGVSLVIPKNEIFGVIGLSGAGKSTLVRCLNLLETPDAGEIMIDGENLLTMGKEQLRLRRQKIGMVFQHFNLLEQQTVLDNVCFPLQECGSVAEVFENPNSSAAKRLLLIGETEEEMEDVG
jgi:D-methionine transport system ATP-binding protein